MTPVPSYRPLEIEQHASNFLSNYWLPSQIWVDIEYIVEKDLNVVIDYAFLDSERAIGLIGVRDDGKQVIVVDEKLADEFPLVYRSTLATEVGHLILHKDMLATVKTPDEALQLHNSLTEAEYTIMEADANRFALAVLMPSTQFEQSCREMYTDWFARIKETVGSVTPSYLQGKLAEELAKRFQVSIKAAKLRLERLKLSIPILEAARRNKPSLDPYPQTSSSH